MRQPTRGRRRSRPLGQVVEVEPVDWGEEQMLSVMAQEKVGSGLEPHMFGKHIEIGPPPPARRVVQQHLWSRGL